MSTPSFCDDYENAKKVIQETNHVKETVETFQQLADRLEDLENNHELVKEENDDELLKELNQGVISLYEDINAYELEHLQNEPYDANNAILELHPGAGGTESQDWASMLLRMYQRWAEQKSYTVETLN